ncbi:MAG: ATP-dependent DNA helicase RecQ [Selenomonadaceae bacterium]|nr:ATP-dependent DNA helicase RecQ [Selenomonadaceae bacterium]
MKEIILNALRGQILNLPQDKNIFVLKGVPLEFVGEENFSEDLERAADNPFKYFSDLMSGGRKFLSYEEFLLLRAFILAQYDSVYILKNNLFMEQYSIENKFGDATKNFLLEHFTEPENIIDEPAENSGSVTKLAELFIGLKDCGEFFIGVYNDEQIFSEPRIKVLNLFANVDEELAEINSDAAPNFFDLQEESDFTELVREIIFTPPEKIFVRTHNYIGDKEKLNDRLKILAAQIEIVRVLPEKFTRGFESRDDFKNILKCHWGYDAFRDLKVYDLQELNAGKKVTRDVSQEQIIADIVRQVELCRDDKNFRDVFVTAPTGAGKSVIFQIPAIYLAEKYELLTIVISPLIGLMTDQVKNLEVKNYRQVATINSDISPIIKEEVIGKVAAGNCNILYISPETLLGRSDVEQLIGDRIIGLVVIDEAHIVTTWGKQFRPDYWYLGDHIRKLRKVQRERKGHSFAIATFTATAIFHGAEDMYEDTINSLHMRDPITYLGYVKRGDIEIKIDKKNFDKGERAEFELAKFTDIENAVLRAKIFKRKTLIYFPEIKLIETAKIILQNRNNFDSVSIYHGQLNKDDKRENYEKFLHGDKFVMLATKAFGMGIDIDDIEIVMHFAPTGNVCDYVQEIGRAARRKNLRGEALYHYDRSDFKYIKRLHGLSAIKKYQLVAVAKKICELWDFKRKSNLLLDAENFTYIFDKYADESTAINKVKTALLIIQKDFELKSGGFSPLTVRPIPLFAIGFFVISPALQKNLVNDFGKCLTEINRTLHICRVNLQMIWEKNFRDKSFPQFKYLLYSKSDKISFNKKYPLQPALCVEIKFEEDFRAIFKNLFGRFKAAVNRSVNDSKYLSVDDLIAEMKISKYRAQNICEILIASMNSYRKNFNKKTYSIFAEKTYPNGSVHYLFNTAIRFYFNWVEKIFNEIVAETKDEILYITDANAERAKEINTVLGILEALGVLNFKMTGGANSQLYIHINQIRNLKNIIDAHYTNKILESVAQRHKISVEMLTYIYENDFDNDKIWDLLEDYFIGKIPAEVQSVVKGSMSI